MRLFTVILFLIILTSHSFANPKSITKHWNDAKIHWHTYAEGVKAAKLANKPILIVFHTTWCPHCLNYRKQFYSPQVTKLSENFIFVMVDRDVEPKINAKYSIDGGYVPRTMILKPSAVADKKITGPHPNYPYFLDTGTPRDLIKMMSVASAKYAR